MMKTSENQYSSLPKPTFVMRKVVKMFGLFPTGPTGKGSHAIDDLHRALSLLFGDGKGNYPEGAYLDMMMIHNLNFMNEVDALYEGYENTDPSLERIGALAALRDYRDGTNRTGLNPENKNLYVILVFWPSRSLSQYVYDTT